MKGLKPDTLKALAEIHEFDKVIVIAEQNREEGQMPLQTVATWGRSETDKYHAADFGDFLKFTMLGWDPKQEIVHEDFRKEN